MTTTRMLCIGGIDEDGIWIDTGCVVDGFTLEAFFDEVERRPGMDAPPTADEAAELDAQTEGDPNYQRWVAEGSPVAAWGWHSMTFDGITTRPVEWPVI